MPGRKPLPTQLKIVRGTARKCRLNKREPAPDASMPKMPGSLSPDAKKHWKKISSRLHDAGILTVIDSDALEAYCEAYSVWRHATDEIAKRGPVIEDEKGVLKRSPYFSVAQGAFDQMKALLTEFGMTPSSRTKVQSTKSDQEKTDLDDIL